MPVPGQAAPSGESRLEVFVLPGIGEVRAGDDLAALILAADADAAAAAGAAGAATTGTAAAGTAATGAATAGAATTGSAATGAATAGAAAAGAATAGAAGPARSVLADGDILAVTSKIVSKAEGRQVAAADREQAITDETVRVVATRVHPGGITRIVQNRQGLVMAAAGVDASNVVEGTVLLLPVDPDASARALCAALRARTGLRLGLLITDTAGRPWRDGQTDIAIGAAGVAVLDDLRGSADAHGRRLDVTIAAVADEIAGAADLIKGKTSGNPVAVLRGLGHLVGAIDAGDRGARRLQRDSTQDMFRLGSAEAYAEGYAAGVAAGVAAAAASSAAVDASAEPATPPASANPPASAAPADAPETDKATGDVTTEVPGKAPSGAPTGHSAAPRETPPAEAAVEAPPGPANGPEVPPRESAPADVAVGARSESGEGPEVPPRGSAFG